MLAIALVFVVLGNVVIWVRADGKLLVLMPFQHAIAPGRVVVFALNLLV